ncbi:MAG: deoxyribodipyrimidine photo-lyase, partial [Proteobacteria bacterium]|nr:deoxyribodipyrimidine photo-lyase [Pseudomonadota bacterium]
DLRIAGNPALQANWKINQGKVLGLFCFDKKFLGREDFSPNRFQLFLQTLLGLQASLKDAGGDLLFLDIGPEAAFASLIEKLTQEGKALPSLVSWNRDYEPFARNRDEKMEKWFKSRGIGVATERDHCLIEPHEIYKGEDRESAYQVYSPYSRKWMEHLKTAGIKARIEIQKRGLDYLDSLSKKGKTDPIFTVKWKDLLKTAEMGAVLEDYREKNSKWVTIPIPAAGTVEALKRLREFKKNITNYGKHRDIPSVDGTSKLSHFFKNGSLTGAQVIAELELDRPGKLKEGEEKFLKEIIWREFYYHILWHYPRVEKTAFLEKFQKLAWENNEVYFKAWKEGRTGYPIVDAGMRQLAQTGWMHNRVRMIVASFLTKDLLIDWRWGEKYFMEVLLDGDLAPNNGGWQWAASTGCDPQPYFRIFNPYLQSKKFDPNGSYIREFVPELKGLSDKEIHEPGVNRPKNYPAPIVEHSVQREKALKIYGAKS